MYVFVHPFQFSYILLFCCSPEWHIGLLCGWIKSLVVAITKARWVSVLLNLIRSYSKFQMLYLLINKNSYCPWHFSVHCCLLWFWPNLSTKLISEEIVCYRPSQEEYSEDAYCSNNSDILDSLPLVKQYLAAECLGKSDGDCKIAYPHCSKSPLDMFSQIYNLELFTEWN